LAYLYFDDIFIEVPDDIDEFGVLRVIKDRFNTDVIGIKRVASFSGKHGKLVEYIVQIPEGHQSAKVMVTENPINLLMEFYLSGIGW